MADANIWADWERLIPPEPAAIHYPLSGLNADERRALVERLENTAPYFRGGPHAEQEHDTLDAYRSLRFSPESEAAIQAQQAAFQKSLTAAVAREPLLQAALRDWDALPDADKKKALAMVAGLQAEACGIPPPSIYLFREKSATSGVNHGALIGINLEGKDFAACVETLAHETRHTYQRALAGQLSRLPADSPLRSAAEIFSLNFSLNRKGAFGGNNTFAHDAEPIERDATAWGNLAYATLTNAAPGGPTRAYGAQAVQSGPPSAPPVP